MNDELRRIWPDEDRRNAALAPVRTDEKVAKVNGHSRPTSEADLVSSDVTVAQALLERLIYRTTTANGIDRETLLNLDTEGWGI